MLSSIYLAAEDEPGLCVGRRLVAEAPSLSVHTERNGHGYGFLKTRIANFQQMGKYGLPVLLLTDLDRDPCPSEKIRKWLGTKPVPGFLFRICVREVEAWLLAHREAMASFLSVAIERVPQNPEVLENPKETLISIAQRSKQRKIRSGFQPTGSATIGPEYNSLLACFIKDFWDMDVASKSAPSLTKARQRIAELEALIIT